MGSSFNYVIVPKKIQSHEDLQNFYEKEKQKLLDRYGDEFEGYTGDMAVDNGELLIKEDLHLSLEDYKTLTKNSFEDDYGSVEKIMDFVENYVEKWGPSLAIRVNEQWVICGAYSD